MKKAIQIQYVIAAVKAVLLGGKEGLRDYIRDHAGTAPYPVLAQLLFAEGILEAFREAAAGPAGRLLPASVGRIIEDVFYDIEEEVNRYEADLYEAELLEREALEKEFVEDCQILYVSDPIEETLEEKRERNLRKYDVLYGEDLSEYDFEGPLLPASRVAELAREFELAHPDHDYEDTYARGLAYKLVNFLEWTPRKEFAYGEVLARLDY